MRAPVSVDLFLIAAHRVAAAHVDQLLVGRNRIVGFVLFQDRSSQALEEDAAVGLLLIGVSAVGVRSSVDHLLVGLRGVVKPAQDVEQKTLVKASFQGTRIKLASLWMVARASW